MAQHLIKMKCTLPTFNKTSDDEMSFTLGVVWFPASTRQASHAVRLHAVWLESNPPTSQPPPLNLSALSPHFMAYDSYAISCGTPQSATIAAW